MGGVSSRSLWRARRRCHPREIGILASGVLSLAEDAGKPGIRACPDVASRGGADALLRGSGINGRPPDPGTQVITTSCGEWPRRACGRGGHAQPGALGRRRRWSHGAGGAATATRGRWAWPWVKPRRGGRAARRRWRGPGRSAPGVRVRGIARWSR